MNEASRARGIKIAFVLSVILLVSQLAFTAMGDGSWKRWLLLGSPLCNATLFGLLLRDRASGERDAASDAPAV
ncbi:MAG: hypothetical protein JWO05_1005 [Gemmatimonadetes bacterium]|nr:hypothetical protein [Gemmatimonadota bacterium]